MMNFQREEALARITNLMMQKNVTAYKITHDIGLSPAAFSEWKKGKGFPNCENMCKIADYLGSSLDYICFGSDVAYKYSRLSEVGKSKVDAYVDVVSDMEV